MEIWDRVVQFVQALHCKYPVYLWRFDEETGEFFLILGSCPDPALWERVFKAGILVDSLRGRQTKDAAPIVLGSTLGLMCGAVFCPEENCFYIIGPVMTDETSADVVMSMLRQLSATHNRIKPDSVEFRRAMTEELQRMPAVTLEEFSGDVMMLYYYITDRQVSRKDIVYLHSDSAAHSPPELPKRDRHRVWATSQALLRMVEEGDLSYQNVFDGAVQMGDGVKLKTRDPLRRAKMSCQIFCSKCSEAAIRGGAIPDAAYYLNNSFLQKMEDAKTVTELADLNHQMYRDFVALVRQNRLRPDLSYPVRICMDYIELHPEEELSLASLSKQAGYSKNHLNGKFKKETGFTISEYIKIVRIERAKFLLAYTNLAIEEISEQLRYTTRGYFSEVFKSVVGVSPPVYREQNRK